MKELNRLKPYGAITGHAVASFEQDGLLFDSSGLLIGLPTTVASSPARLHDAQIQTDALESAKNFLKNILHDTALSKATVFKEAENNNQHWEAVKAAAEDLKVAKFTYQKAETWKLTQE